METYNIKENISNQSAENPTMLTRAILYLLKYVESFETIGDLLELFETIWNHVRPFGPLETISDYPGPVRMRRNVHLRRPVLQEEDECSTSPVKTTG